jgi:hypothetical protein
MTTPRRDPDALLSAYLAVGMEVLPDRVVDAVLDEVHRTRQRTVIGPWRTRPISRATFAAAAVVAMLALGAALLVIGGGPSPTPSVEPSPSLPAIVAPSSTPDGPSAGPTASPVSDPAGLWIATGTMGTPRFEHAAVRLLDGRVLVVGCCGGGSDASVEVTTSAELYDPHSGTWSATGSLANGLRANVVGRATLLRDGRVLALVAGDADDEVGAEVYDPASGTWTATGQMVRGAHYVGDIATELQDGRVLVAGVNGAQLYDPDSGTWIATGKMTMPRNYTAAALLPDGNVLVAGGFDIGDRQSDVAELYDPNTGSWTAIASPRGAHRDPTATVLRDGNVLVAGRDNGALEWEIYDAATRTWTELAEGPGFGYGTASLLSDGTVLLADLRGRADGPEPPCPATALYDPRTGSWTTASSMLRCAGGSSFTLLLDGTVLAAGGSDCNDDGVCVLTGAAELYVPAGVSPPPLPAFPSPPPPVFPTPTPVPTPLPPATGPVPPNARTWKVTVDNQSSDPMTLIVAEFDENGITQLVGSATPNVVPAGATVKVTFLFPAKSDPDDGWIFVNPRPGPEGPLVGAADIGIPGKILITAEGVVVWASP